MCKRHWIPILLVVGIVAFSGLPGAAVNAVPIAVSNATITVDADLAQPPAGTILMGSPANTLAIYRFTETSNVESVRVTDLAVFASSSASVTPFANVELWNGSTLVGTSGGSSAASGGFSYLFHLLHPVTIPQAGSVSLTLKGDVMPYASLPEAANTTFSFLINSTTSITAIGASSNQAATISSIAGASGNAMTILSGVATTAPTVTISTDSPLPDGILGQVYSTNIYATSTNATDTLTWSLASGTLPDALTLNAGTGLLSGTPNATGTFAFAVGVANGDSSASTTKSFTLTINDVSAPTSTPSSTVTLNPPAGALDDGQVGAAYVPPHFTATNSAIATDTFTFTVTVGSLPNGLALNTASGNLSATIEGTPTTEGTSTFSITAASITDPNASTTQAYTIYVNPAPVSNNGGGGGGAESGGGGGGDYYYYNSTSTGGQVLGASTTNPFALLQSLTQQLIALEKELITVQFQQAGCSPNFTKNLSLGMNDSQVKYLQQVLNYSNLTQVAASGIGSPGNESTYFGFATKKAVIIFQNIFADEILKPIGLTSGNGYVGASTRAQLNTLCSAE
ncbi:MAG: putative Ig domain-containing protein [Minisyncoccia bacterium]|jgi:hypothetical protein